MPGAIGKPATLDEYMDWAKATLGIDYRSTREENRFSSNLTSALNTIQASDFYKKLSDFLLASDKIYQKRANTPLLMTADAKFLLKSYQSAINKSFRQNVLWNGGYPAPPHGNWVTQNNWYEVFNDLIRTTVVCKFLDGPAFLAAQLSELCTSLGLPSDSYSQQKDVGYYAYHFYTRIPTTLVDANWDAVNVKISVEIQITTQLQEVLRDLTHVFYEDTRLLPTGDTDAWKWEHDNDRFKAAYMSHTLHMLEGIVLQLREQHLKRMRKRKSKGGKR